MGSAGTPCETRTAVLKQCFKYLKDLKTANSSLYTTRDRSFRSDNDSRSDSKRERAWPMVGRFVGSFCTMSSINSCMNSKPCAP